MGKSAAGSGTTPKKKRPAPWSGKSGAPNQKGTAVNVSEALNLSADLIERNGWWNGGPMNEGSPLCASNAMASTHVAGNTDDGWDAA